MSYGIYVNKRVRVIGEELYGKVLREFASEVLVAIDDNDQYVNKRVRVKGELYFNKSEVEIVNDKKLSY